MYFPSSWFNTKRRIVTTTRDLRHYALSLVAQAAKRWEDTSRYGRWILPFLGSHTKLRIVTPNSRTPMPPGSQMFVTSLGMRTKGPQISGMPAKETGVEDVFSQFFG
jgi:hypothetical protein